MVVIDHWAFRAFLQALRPSFERMLPSEGRKHLRGTISQRYEEAQGFAEEGLARARGLVTLGIDGHRDRKGRAVWTICRLKMGISVFETCEWSGRRVQTAVEHAKVVQTVIDDDPADSKVELIKADLIDDFFLPSLIRNFRIRRIVMIFSTPLCTANSDANTRLRAGGRAEGRASREGDRLLEACLEVYSASARSQEVPPVFFLENPWGNKSKSLPNRVAKHVANPRAQRHLHDLAALPCEKVHQCRYGGESWKPTAIWHNLGAGGLALERCEGRDRCPYFLRHGQHETNVQERGRARSQILPDALLQAIIGQGAARLPSPSRATTSTN